MSFLLLLASFNFKNKGTETASDLPKTTVLTVADAWKQLPHCLMTVLGPYHTCSHIKQILKFIQFPFTESVDKKAV